MTLLHERVAVADATVGTDLLLNSVWRKSNRPRVIRDAVIAGSASVGDTEVQLLIGAVIVASYPNTIAGSNQKISGLDFLRIGALVPAEEEIRLKVTDAPATNAIDVFLNIDDVG